ncbi:MAG: T9SS type A sorting domain-containing protein, partial [Cytophagaceae bacterium]|nr:T9SS type A sorting domain-containing protein [Cytophagaceae bacterium]
TNSTSTDIICAGASATFTASVTGNNGAVSYQWQKDNANISGANGNTYATSSGGSYRVIVTDGKGCSATSNAVVVSNSALSVSASAPTDLICPGASVTFSAAVAGNTGGVNYQWQNSGNNASNDNPFTTGSGGSYRVIVTDGKGCQATSNTVSVSNSTLSVGISGKDFYCEGGTSVFTQLKANPSGGAGGYGYQWRKDNQPISGQIGLTADLFAGNYTVEVADSRGCRFVSPTATVRALPRPTASAGPGGEIVGPDLYDLTKLNVTTASGGTPGYTYQWSANPAVKISLKDTDARPAIGPFTRDATVFLVVTDAAGCKSDTAKVLLKYFPCNLTNKIVGNNYVCTNGRTTLNANAAAGYGDPKTYQYQWRVNGNLVPNTVDSMKIQAAIGGLYTLLATDNKGCRRTDTLQLAELPRPLVNIAGASSICKGTTSTLTATVIGGQPKYTFQWKNDATILPIDSARLSTPVGGNFTLTVTDSKGCVGSSQTFTLTPKGTELSVAITPAGPTTVYSPNTVTLNGTSSGGTTLQWQKNGQTIPGANTANYVVKDPGQANYALAVGSNDGCLFASQPITVNIIVPTSVAPALAAGWTVNAFPNPTNGRLIVEVSLETAQPLALRLTDLSGRAVSSYQSNQPSTRHVTELDLSEQTNGLYLLHLEAGGQHAVQKVVKIN